MSRSLLLEEGHVPSGMSRQVVVLAAALLVLGCASPVHAASDATHLEERSCAGLADVASSPCPGLRPGSWISTESRGRCTANFVFTDKKELFLGTAGHCVQKVGEPVLSRSMGVIFGKVTYRTRPARPAESKDAPPSMAFDHDFALIQVFEKYRDFVDPQACAWGGPVGLFTGRRIDMTEVRYMGFGTGLGSIPGTDESQPLTYARRGEAPEISDPGAFRFIGPATPGDSGAPVLLEDRLALGIATVTGISLTVDPAGTSLNGTVGGGRLPTLMKDASTEMDRPIFLVTADWRLVK